MGTAFTKSRDRKDVEARNNAKSASGEPDDTDSQELSPLVWRIASLTILAGAAFIRLYELGLKPMHHDEGVNGFFLTNLYRTGEYNYDPTNYHGPTLYYFALGITKFNAFLFGQAAGLSTVAVRLVPVIFGVATVWLILCLRRRIGTIGALSAAALIALSPGHIYISRYFIHEAHFVFFTLGIVVAALNFYDRKRPTAIAWATLALILLVILVPSIYRLLSLSFPSLYPSIKITFAFVLGSGLTYAAFYFLRSEDEGRPIYLLLAFASAAFLFATKETAIINLGVLGLALAVALVYMRLARKEAVPSWEKKRAPKKKKKKRRAPKESWLDRFGGVPNVALWSSVGLALFVLISITFYSSFFTYPEGVGKALESFQVWAKTGRNEHTQHGYLGYLNWLIQEEAPLLFLALVGAIIALIRRQDRFAVFAGAWAFGTFAAYTLIPYKTPWLMLSFIVPLAIIGGYAVNELYHYGGILTLRFAALGAVLCALVISGAQSVRLNFYHYDDDRYPYVYAHTPRELLNLVNKIEELAKRAGTGKETGITIMAEAYWPLPWYLRNYPNAGFFGHMVETTQPLVIGSVEQIPELDEKLGDRYKIVDTYPLRPSVQLVLYAWRELAEQ